MDSQTVNAGECAYEPMVPEKNNYVFSGWYSDNNLSNKYDFYKPVTNDVVLYAKWDSLDFFLSADSYSVLAGDTVSLYVNSNTKVDSVAINYGTDGDLGNIITAFDNGENGDAYAGDGIYSCELELETSEDTEFDFVASSDSKMSNQISINCYTPITRTMRRAMSDVSSAMSALTSSSEFKAKTDDEKIETILNELAFYEKRGQIKKGSIYADAENHIVSFLYLGDIMGSVMYEDFSSLTSGIVGSESLGESNVTNEDSTKYSYNYSWVDTADEYVFGDDLERGNAVILASLPAFETETENINSDKALGEAVRENFIDYDINMNFIWTPTVEDYKHLSDYDIIYISTHGIVSPITDADPSSGKPRVIAVEPTFAIREPNNNFDNGLYDVELKDKQIIYSGVSESGYAMFSVRPRFFRQQYSPVSLATSFVCAESCQSMGAGQGDNKLYYDYSMANAFLSRSAKSYVGFHNSVAKNYTGSFMTRYVGYLSEGCTSGEAYDNTLNDVGANQTEWWIRTFGEDGWEDFKKDPWEEGEPFNENVHVAYPVLNGRRDSKLGEISIRGFETYNAQTGNIVGWQCAGDVRSVTHFGDFDALDGNRMAVLGTKAKSAILETHNYSYKTTYTMGSKISRVVTIPGMADALRFDYGFVTDKPSEYWGESYAALFNVKLTDLNGNELHYAIKDYGDTFVSNWSIPQYMRRYKREGDTTWKIDSDYCKSVWWPLNGVSYFPGGSSMYAFGSHRMGINVRPWQGETVVVTFELIDREDVNSYLLLDDVVFTSGVIYNKGVEKINNESPDDVAVG